MGVDENVVVKDILEYLSLRHDCFAWRSNQIPVRGRRFVGLKGVSDIIGMIDGVFLAIECKTDEGKLLPEQEAFLNKVIEMGGIAILARNVNDVVEQLKND